ncbi:hypothetical protein J2785_001437 [Burkholderia ambifaria]|nr:hypothetical protein [Burkholderia ambifaria]
MKIGARRLFAAAALAAGAVPATVIAIAPLPRALPIQRGNGQFAPGDYTYAA